jgi:ribulose-5-phosphate 4-epimerase/fuculose-1-phosphate aldolase
MEATARAELHATLLRMVADGLVVGSAGNASVRLGERSLVVSAGGRPVRPTGAR